MNRDGRAYNLPMTVYWSRVHQQRHVTRCLMNFAVGERNVAIRYRFCIWLSNMNVIIVVNPTYEHLPI